jgi:hypothetical protein
LLQRQWAQKLFSVQLSVFLPRLLFCSIFSARLAQKFEHRVLLTLGKREVKLVMVPSLNMALAANAILSPPEFVPQSVKYRRVFGMYHANWIDKVVKKTLFGFRFRLNTRPFVINPIVDSLFSFAASPYVFGNLV